jgi:hypothetical protein
MSQSPALSIDPEKGDLYAMGGTPIMALAILCVPVDKIWQRWCAEFSKAGRWWIAFWAGNLQALTKGRLGRLCPSRVDAVEKDFRNIDSNQRRTRKFDSKVDS